MKWPNSKQLSIFVFAVVTLTSLVRHEVLTGNTRVVDWDGYGYYAYLPALFVYGDIEHYAFAEEHLATYEMSSDLYQLMITENDRRFPIYNIGLAVIWTPAFLLTHAIVLLTGCAPADGMSFPYQLMVVLMGLLFVWLALRYLRRFLEGYFPDTVVGLTLLGVGLGTNIFYYQVEGPDVTHGYLFGLYAVFLWSFGRIAIAERASFRQLATCGFLAGLLCLVRSSEIVLFAIPACYGLQNWKTLRRNFRRTAIIFGVALLVFSLQLIYYKIGTDAWWRDGYAGLGFDWLSPHIYEGFFSYRRGWLVYTPLMFFGLAGVFFTPKQWRLPLVIFLIGNCYILFSWHIWWYGDSFGSRPVTQSYALLALPLAAFIAWFLGASSGADVERSGIPHSAGAGAKAEGKARRKAPYATLLLLPFIILNLFQHWQYNQRILPLDFVNKTYYWYVFGQTQLDKKARVYLDTDERLPQGEYTETPLPTLPLPTSIPAKSSREFTNLLDHRAAKNTATATRWLRTRLDFSYHGETYDKWKNPMIVTEHKRGDTMLKYVQVKIPPVIDNPSQDFITFDLSLTGYRAGDQLRQYVWNLSQDSLTVTDYNVSILR